MDLRNLHTFIQAAELSSFSRAGEKLGYSQPTVSMQIKQLEQELGFPLFDRVGHTVRLTDKGRAVLAQAQDICRMCRSLTEGGDEEVRGTVRLAMADSLCAPLISRGFARLRSRWPQLSLHLTTAGTDELFRLLDHNEVDLVCTLDSRIYNTNYVIAAEEKVGVHFIVSAANPLAGNKQLSLEDLLRSPLLLTEKGMSYRRLLDEWLSRRALEVQPILELGRADLLCALAEEGAGVSFLPDYVTEDAVRRGSIVRLDAEGFHPELWMQLLYHRDKWLSRPMEAVLDQVGNFPLFDPV